MKTTERHFQNYKENIVGQDTVLDLPYGRKKLIYADWIASGRLYKPIEDLISNKIGAMVANTHSYSSETGQTITLCYGKARQIIKDHINAGKKDILLTTGSGSTGALAKLLRIMGLRWPQAAKAKAIFDENERPVVFITHMEHHSNHVPWMESVADVVILPPDEKMQVNPDVLREKITAYQDRPMKIGAFTACSNVTGIITPYHELAIIMHQHGGFCFMDFAASAPYTEINMHPEDPLQRLDAIFFSPHKFLGGPGSCGVLAFNKTLYPYDCPDHPGGGNVKWTDPWGNHSFFDDIEAREDGGTPGFLQVIKAALSIKLKESMGLDNIRKRETELLEVCISELSQIPKVFILGEETHNRIGCVSFGISGVHYNLIVRLLNDRFGIQVRGGWSCASTYSHYLFNINKGLSKVITTNIDEKNFTDKPDWVRLSLHPTMANEELLFITNAVRLIAVNIDEWEKDYTYCPHNNEFVHNSYPQKEINDFSHWFDV